MAAMATVELSQKTMVHHMHIALPELVPEEGDEL